MRNIRLIARLDVNAPNLVKGIQFEGLRKLGDPNLFAKKYYNDGVDEIYYEDIVASLYERNSLVDIVEKTTEEIFVPVTVGGGLRHVDDVAAVLRAGADKVSINTEAIKRPQIIRKCPTVLAVSVWYCLFRQSSREIGGRRILIMAGNGVE